MDRRHTRKVAREETKPRMKERRRESLSRGTDISSSSLVTVRRDHLFFSLAKSGDPIPTHSVEARQRPFPKVQSARLAKSEP